jgi:hypothetical protein
LEEHEVDLLLEAPVRRGRGFSIIVRAKLPHGTSGTNSP